MSLLPCPTCPWRVDKDASTIPGYNQEKPRPIFINCKCGFSSIVFDEEDANIILSGHAVLCSLNPNREAECHAAMLRVMNRPKKERSCRDD